jgi:hypothetical protein
VQPDEYSYSYDFKDSVLHLNWSGGEVFIGYTVETKGWIAVGYGSTKMNDAHIFIGFVDDGEAQFSEHTGRGHAHSKSDARYVQSYKLSEKSGLTTLELEIPEEDMIDSGQKTLEIILGYGKRDSFNQYHSGTRTGLSVDIVR